MSSLRIQCPPQTYSRLFRPWDMSQRSAAAAAAVTHTHQAPAAPNANAAAGVSAVGQASNMAPGNHPTAAQNLSTKRVGTPPTAANTIKVEFLKVEDDAMEAEQSDTEDEEVEVDDEDYLHTSRTSECASSQSNFSQLSDENDIYQHEQRAARTISGVQPTVTRSTSQSSSNNGFGTRSSSAAHRQAMPAAAHHLNARELFEAHHQQQLHLLAQNVLPTTTALPATAMPAEFFYENGTAQAAAMSRTCEVATALPPTSLMPASASSAAAAAAAAAATAASFVGMDAYTYGLMEQEYARIMAEEAHLKAINARKQRPKKFKCPHCDVAFSNNGQLKGHIRIHTGERPFKCDVESCGKTFTRNEELTRHKRIHTGLRPYPCAACGKKFGRRDHLKKHMKTHMPQERQLGPAIFVPMYPYLYGY
ncbi:PREDICTED: adult enhancer factor 1 [Rhagoletis zephyria]|uniref:adult enhancer factor 1 n=1 Tax=Rhagoletis zephyria TaxID=28612 RepID=UPI0008119AAD|nr:PREDICTED: adult enhancer factor 1 [Rhagoletis zephyria]